MRTEIQDQARQPGFRRVTLPHAGRAIAGKLTDNGINEIVWNIDGQLVPGHDELDERGLKPATTCTTLTKDFFHPLQDFLLYGLIFSLDRRGELRQQILLFSR